MRTEMRVFVTTVECGKCGRTQYWYEPPGGTYVTGDASEQRVLGDVYCELCSWGVLGNFCENWVSGQGFTLQN